MSKGELYFGLQMYNKLVIIPPFLFPHNKIKEKEKVKSVSIICFSRQKLSTRLTGLFSFQIEHRALFWNFSKY